VFKFLTAQEQGFSVSQDLLTVFAFVTGTSAFVVVRMLVNVILKNERGNNFGLFNDHIWFDLTEKLRSYLINSTPHKLGAVFGVAKFSTIAIKMATKLLMHRKHRWVVAHRYASADVIPNMAPSHLLEDVDVAFTVKQSGNVLNVHDLHKLLQVGMRMLANSEKTRCPARKGAEGQPRAKQVKVSPGVCNEHGPTPEGKMCSGLHGDMQRLAEMTSPALMYHQFTGMSRQVTNRNTKYIHWRPHARRNMVPLDPDRFSVNQDAMVRLIGWAGNMTLSNAFLQGVLGA
jgi:hypothetical protein